MYMPTLGRWISKDPLPGNGEPEVLYTHQYVAERIHAILQPYTYVQNSPTGDTDPSGLAPLVKEGLPRGANVWWFTYTDNPQGQCDGKPGYRWAVRQHFRGKRPFPAQWGNEVPKQTWQFNFVTMSGLKLTADGKCEPIKANAVVLDLHRTVVKSAGGKPISVDVRVDDDLALKRIEGLKPGERICLVLEVVKKHLGFNKSRTILPGMPNPRLNPRLATPADKAAYAGMRGPFLYMQTIYLFKGCHCCACEKYFKKFAEDPLWPGDGTNWAFELYNVGAAADTKFTPTPKLKNVIARTCYRKCD